MLKKTGITILDYIVKGQIWLHNVAKPDMVIPIVILILFKLGSFMIYHIVKPIYGLLLFCWNYLQEPGLQSFVIVQFKSWLALFNPLLHNSNNFCLIVWCNDVAT